MKTNQQLRHIKSSIKYIQSLSTQISLEELNHQLDLLCREIDLQVINNMDSDLTIKTPSDFECIHEDVRSGGTGKAGQIVWHTICNDCGKEWKI